MDNITHSLTGWAMARAGLGRFSPRAALLLILSANTPDIDILALTQGSLYYFEAHRGYTHSLLCLPFMAALPVLVVALIFRQRLPWLRAWLLCCAGVASHLLIDWTNNYGIRLLLPFSSRWFYLDLNSLYDGFIMAVLLLAAVWPFFAWLVNGEIGDRSPAGRGIARFALTFFVVFDCCRAVLHHRAIAKLESRLYEDVPPVRTAAFPEPFNPLRWRSVVETDSAYLVLTVNPFTELDLTSTQNYFKAEATPAIERAKTEESFRYLLYFSRYPIWSEASVQVNGRPGKRVELTDLRFGRPGAGSFHCIALLDNNNQLVQSWFTYGSGINLGWGDNGHS